MKGFFEQSHLEQSATRKHKGKLVSCTACGLYKYVLTPKMEPFGENKKQIMVIGEAPGEEEDRKGHPWQGRAGQALQRKYQEFGIDLFEDCICLNSVHCRPVDDSGNNRAPTDYEVACCRDSVVSTIKQYNPKVIILHGNAAVSSLITGLRWQDHPSGISAWRGWTIPDREFKAWVCPTFHPSYIERQKDSNDGGAEAVWSEDIQQALRKVNEPLPNYPDEDRCISTNIDPEGVLLTLVRSRPKYLALDIETTGIKPYNREQHKIVCISLCPSEDRSYAIPFPIEERQRRLLKRLLEDPDIGKIAANMKFEDTWLQVLHGITPYPWVFDTMQAAHILDNRAGITGLKFQSYVNFGITHYGKSIGPYLDSPDENTPNKLADLWKNVSLFDELLRYCAMDSLFTYRLAMKQMDFLGMEALG